jgi:hypothetical protein
LGKGWCVEDVVSANMSTLSTSLLAASTTFSPSEKSRQQGGLTQKFNRQFNLDRTFIDHVNDHKFFFWHRMIIDLSIKNIIIVNSYAQPSCLCK